MKLFERVPTLLLLWIAQISLMSSDLKFRNQPNLTAQIYIMGSCNQCRKQKLCGEEQSGLNLAQMERLFFAGRHSFHRNSSAIFLAALCIMLKTWCASPSIGNIINNETPTVVKVSRFSISNTPGLNIFARLNSTGPFPLELTCR